MPVGVSSQQNRIWNMEWNDAGAQVLLEYKSICYPYSDCIRLG